MQALNDDKIVRKEDLCDELHEGNPTTFFVCVGMSGSLPSSVTFFCEARDAYAFADSLALEASEIADVDDKALLDICV